MKSRPLPTEGDMGASIEARTPEFTYYNKDQVTGQMSALVAHPEEGYIEILIGELGRATISIKDLRKFALGASDLEQIYRQFNQSFTTQT